MKTTEREQIIDKVPTEDAEAALRALVETLPRGELDAELCQVLAFRTGDPADFWPRLIEAHDAWRAERGLAPSPIPFGLGE